MSSVLGYTVLTFLLHFFHQMSEVHSQERVSRTGLRSLLENQRYPNFYPTRARRAKATSEEEEEPPFWAQRGRAYEGVSPTWPRSLDSANTLEDLPALWNPPVQQVSGSDKDMALWGNRGPSPHASLPDCLDPGVAVPYAEEPRVVVIERRDISEDDPRGYRQFWASRGRRDQFGPRAKPSKRSTVKLSGAGQKYEDLHRSLAG